MPETDGPFSRAEGDEEQLPVIDPDAEAVADEDRRGDDSQEAVDDGPRVTTEDA
jgi:hypothetical protein